MNFLTLVAAGTGGVFLFHHRLRHHRGGDAAEQAGLCGAADGLGSEPVAAPVTEMFYRTYFFWLIVLLATPVITMRLFALEKASGHV
jgi:hypothetical protein